MSRRLVVVGGGAAGTAAAYAAIGAGAEVTWVRGRPGATSLTSGAIDGTREEGERALAAAGLRAFVDALGIWEISVDGCRVATMSGVVREARGRDRRVLDLAPVRAGTVVVVDVARRGWDAPGLARAWNGDAWARTRGLSFVSISCGVLRFAEEAWLMDGDLALRHDDPERVGWLITELRRAVAGRDVSAIVLGPWLGFRIAAAERLSRELGVPVGEPLSAPGGPAGARFEWARDQCLAGARVTRVDGQVRAMRARSGRIELDIESAKAVDADAVVLAVGGLAGGGIVWGASDQGFAPSFASDLALGCLGARLGSTGSPRGPLFEPFAWSGACEAAGFERVGIWTDDQGRARDATGTAFDGVLVAGDAASDRPRTMLEAIRAGVAAGAFAGRDTA